MKPIEVLMRQARTRPRDTAFLFGEKAWTYETIAAESERLARGMTARGVKPGDRVVLHMMNRPEYILAFYACFRLGAIAVPLRTAFKFAELGPLLQRLKPALYVGEAALYENVAPIDASVLPRDRRFVVGGPPQGQDGVRWEKLFEGGTDALVLPGADTPAVLITTSGTTGEPKFVVHTAATLSESVDLLIDRCGWSGDDVMAMPLALAHGSGLFISMSLIRAGARFVLLESFDPAAVLDAIEDHRCTIHLGFPAQYAAMLASLSDRPRNLTSLRLCLTGGDSCPINLQLRVNAEFGAPLYNFWAATESVGNLTFGRRPGPFMQIVDRTRVRLVDEKGNETAEGETGELLVCGPNLFAGYWEDPRATAESIRDGWYHTGDLMQRRGDELTYVARKKDIIIRGGTNISPVEVEQAVVAAHPAVEEAALVGVPDDVLGQRVYGFVKLANGQRPEVVLDILENLSTRLAADKVPEQPFVLIAPKCAEQGRSQFAATHGRRSRIGSGCTDRRVIDTAGTRRRKAVHRRHPGRIGFRAITSTEIGRPIACAWPPASEMSSSGDSGMRGLFSTIVFTALLTTRVADAQTVGMARSPTPPRTAPLASMPSPNLRMAAGAPIGHRQPRVKDVPSEDPGALEVIGEEDRRVDHKLTICRGC